MKAKLVYATVITRVVVPDDAADDQIRAVALPRLVANLINDCAELIDEIKDDVESPYNSQFDTLTKGTQLPCNIPM